MYSAIMYLSLATEPSLSTAELEALSRQSAIRNHGQQITGYLYENHGVFVQFLEGPAAQLDALMASIRRDPSHGIVSEASLPVQQGRYFPSWEMHLLKPSMLTAHTALEQMFFDLEEQQVVTPTVALDLLEALAQIVTLPRTEGG